MSVNVVFGLPSPPFGGLYILILSILGSLFNEGSGERWLTGVLGFGILLPMLSTGASRLLMLRSVGVLENSERTRDVRFAYLELDSRRRKSVRKALESCW